MWFKLFLLLMLFNNDCDNIIFYLILFKTLPNYLKVFFLN